MFTDTTTNTTQKRRENIYMYAYFPDTRESALAGGQQPNFWTKKDGVVVDLKPAITGQLVEVRHVLDERDEKKPKLQVQIILQSVKMDGSNEPALYCIQSNINATTREILARLATVKKASTVTISLYNVVLTNGNRKVGVGVNVDGLKITKEMKDLTIDKGVELGLIKVKEDEFSDEKTYRYQNPKNVLDPEWYDMTLINKCRAIEIPECTVDRFI